MQLSLLEVEELEKQDKFFIMMDYMEPFEPIPPQGKSHSYYSIDYSTIHMVDFI